MSDISPPQIEGFVTEFLSRKLPDCVELKAKPEDGFHFIEQGGLDSIGFVELVSATEAEFKVSPDFLELEPEEFLTLGGFVSAFLTAWREQNEN